MRRKPDGRPPDFSVNKETELRICGPGLGSPPLFFPPAFKLSPTIVGDRRERGRNRPKSACCTLVEGFVRVGHGLQ